MIINFTAILPDPGTKSAAKLELAVTNLQWDLPTACSYKINGPGMDGLVIHSYILHYGEFQYTLA